MFLIISSLICTSLVFLYLFRTFGIGVLFKPSASLASHLHPLDLLKHSTRKILSTIYALPISFIVFVVSVESSGFRDLLASFLVDALSEQFKNQIDSDVTKLFVNAPKSVYPFIIIMSAIILFGPYIGILLKKIQRVVIKSSQVLRNTDRVSIKYAEYLLNLDDLSYEKILNKVNINSKVNFDINTKFQQASEVSKLAYQLIYAVKDEIPLYGVDGAIFRRLESAGFASVPRQDPTPPGRTSSFLQYFFAAFVFYILACFAYVFIVPFLGELIIDFEKINFPHPTHNGWLTLTQSIGQFSFGIIFVLFMGIATFEKRRKEKYSKERIVTSVLVIAAWQFAISFFINSMFNLVYVIDTSNDGWENVGTISLIELKMWVSIVISSIAPPVGLTCLVVCVKHRMSDFNIIITMSILVGISFLFAELAYESIAGKIDYYFIHEFLLGVYATSVASFFLYFLMEFRPREINLYARKSQSEAHAAT